MEGCEMKGSSDQVRAVASRDFVSKYRALGRTEFALAVREVKDRLEKEGFPPENTPQVCTALKSKRFLDAEDLELVSAEGPRSMLSTTVVYHYRFRNPQAPAKKNEASTGQTTSEEDPRWIAFQRAAGSLADVFAEFGGGEKFLAWVRGDLQHDELTPKAPSQ
jgi:hypothetical protein